MKVLQGSFWDWVPPARGAAAAIGVFDGVHRGHAAVIEQTKSRAAELGGLATTVVTFDPHPLRLIAPEHAPKLITSLDHKLALLASLDVDTTAVLSFDEEVRSLTPDDFVTDILVGGLGCSLIVVGANFQFGKDRSGDVDTLRTLGLGLGYYTEAVELIGNDAPISSRSIRAAVAAGDVTAAARDLGRLFALRGRVTGGEKRGTAIGFPTANLELAPDLLLPGHGVYAAWAVVGGERHRAAVNVGVRPTFDGHAEVVEAHLLDFDGDLYGSPLELLFVDRIRGEQRFDGIEALQTQIAIDLESVKAALES